MRYNIKENLYNRSTLARDEKILQKAIEEEIRKDSERELTLNPTDSSVFITKITKGEREWRLEKGFEYPVSLDYGLTRVDDRDSSSYLSLLTVFTDDISPEKMISGYIEEYNKLLEGDDYKQLMLNIEICMVLLESRPSDIMKNWSFIKYLNQRGDYEDTKFFDIQKLLCQKDPTRPRITSATGRRKIVNFYEKKMKEEIKLMLPYVEKYIKKEQPKFSLSKNKSGQFKVEYKKITFFHCQTENKCDLYEDIISRIQDRTFKASSDRHDNFLNKCDSYGMFGRLEEIRMSQLRKHYSKEYSQICEALEIDLEKDLKDAIEVVNKYII